jgi:glycine betaine/proline transport system permease protein
MTNILLTTRPTPGIPAVKKIHHGRNLLILVAAFLAASVVLHGKATLYLDRSSLTPLHRWLNSVSTWITFHRDSNPFFLFFINQIRAFINGLVTGLQNLISQPMGDRSSPIIGWLGVIALIALIVYAISRFKVALLATLGMISLGLLGFWTESMQTLALTLAAVILALIIGIPLGILAGTHPKVEKFLVPLLDFSQIMPTFVYLTPITLFFLIGPASATIVTLIYAIPPVLRITSIALHQVPIASLEAGISMGSTKWQTLKKIQLPLAKRTIIVGINQTIMAALAMVTIASLIDAPGLGRVIITALEALDVGTSVRAGLGIVILAIVLDRSTTAAADRATDKESTIELKKRRRIILTLATMATAASVVLSYFWSWAAIFPGTGTIGQLIANWVDSGTGWIQDHLSNTTAAITDFVSYGFINPLQWLLAETPWYVVSIAWVILAFLIGGKRVAIISAICLAGILGTGLWSDSMVTLASTFFAALVTVILGMVIGVWIGRNKKAESIIRPILDAGQVLPAFVYLVPFLGLFGATRFTAILAAIVYAAPAAIKLAADGIRGVPSEMIEAAIAAGSTPWQVITKVQLPAARRGLALATNQGLIYVLAMIVVGGLVGAGGLGYLVVAGFSQETLVGKGLSAGLAIVFLGVMLDRITQAAANKRPLSKVSTH